MCDGGCWAAVGGGPIAVEEVLVDVYPGLFTVGESDFEREPVEGAAIFIDDFRWRCNQS